MIGTRIRSALRPLWRNGKARLQHHLMPPWMKLLSRHFGESQFTLLDIGAGNHAAQGTKYWFPNCRYYGVDIDRSYNNDEADFEAMDGFWELDLTRLEFADIPDDYFDSMVLNQVIEHLFNGDRVLAGLISKVKVGGIIYVEMPGPRSLRLPSMANSLNFHDDATHCRLFTTAEVRGVLTAHGCSVIRAGRRRDLFQVAATPVRAVRHRIQSGRFQGPDFWDLLGFANYVLAQRD